MDRDLAAVIEATKTRALICSDINKQYTYTNSDIIPEGEYLYIPMLVEKSATYSKIKEHLRNSNCKGFFISQKYTESSEYLDLLREYRPENVILANNIYNAGFDLAKFIANEYDIKVILLLGTDEKEPIRNKLTVNLGIENYKYTNCWQRMADPLLRASAGTKYVILEPDITRKLDAELVSKFKSNSLVIYSKISLCAMDKYNDIEDYGDAWVKLADNAPQAIYAKDDNDFLKFPMSDNLHIVDNPADALLRDLGIRYIRNMEIKRKEDSNIIKNDAITPYSVKAAIRDFVAKYKDNKKVLVLSRINNLRKYADSVHNDIFKEITEEIDGVVLINLAKHIPYLRAMNKKTVIKSYEKIDETTLIGIKEFIRWQNDGNLKCLMLTGDNDICTLI